MKVYIESPDQATVKMFENEGFEIAEEVAEAHLVCFTGGSDVSPDMYLEPNTHSHNNPTRDLHCVGIYTRAKAMDIPCVGICRGGQFLNVMNGGRMVQDIHGHGGLTHQVSIIRDHMFAFIDLSFEATSTHHQQIVPEWDYADIIGQAPDGVTEVVYYGDTRDLCFQPHPEYAGAEACREPFFKMLGEILYD